MFRLRARLGRIALVPAIAAAATFVPVDAAQGSTAVTVYVDQANPAANDGGSGTATAPFRTISRAAWQADVNQNAGVATTIVVGPGTYRETVQFSTGLTGTAPITVVGDPAGRTVISGSDVWSGGWAAVGGGVWRRTWTDDWGLSPAPASWGASDLARRRELVFANGALLRQWSTAAELGTAWSGFVVDEAADALLVKLPGLTDPNAARMEVGRRSRVVYAERRNRIALRNLTFQHAVSPTQQAAVSFPGSKDILIEDSVARHNNWAGFNFYGFEAPASVDRVTLRRVDASNNGAVGIAGYRVFDLQVLQSRTNANAFRNAWSGLWWHEDGGIKILAAERWVVDGHLAEGNHGMGIWHDSAGAAGTIRNSVIRRNGGFGLFLEASYGPLLVESTRVCANREIGVAVSQSEDVTIRSTSIFGNTTGNGQLTFTGQDGGRWIDGRLLENRRVTLTGNTIVGHAGGPKVIETTLGDAGWRALASTLAAGGNTYWSTTPAAFNWWADGATGRASYDIARWRSATGQEATSTWAAPAVAPNCDAPFPATGPAWTAAPAPAPTTTVAPAPTTTTPRKKPRR